MIDGMQFVKTVTLYKQEHKRGLAYAEKKR